MKNRTMITIFLCTVLLFLLAAVEYAYVCEPYFPIAGYIANYFRSPYGVFCIVSVILQGFIYTFVYFCKNANIFSILVICGIVLFIASLPVSGTMCAIVYVLFVFISSAICGIREIISFLNRLLKHPRSNSL